MQLNPNFLGRSKEETDMEQIIIDILQSEKIKQLDFSLSRSQLRALETILKHQMPLKYLLFILSSKQKTSLLELLFVALFANTNGEEIEAEEAYESFMMFSQYIWYFHLVDDLRDSQDAFMKLKSDKKIYRDLVIETYDALVEANDKEREVQLLTLNQSIMNEMSLEDVIEYKRVRALIQIKSMQGKAEIHAKVKSVLEKLSEK